MGSIGRSPVRKMAGGQHDVRRKETMQAQDCSKSIRGFFAQFRNAVISFN